MNGYFVDSLQHIQLSMYLNFSSVAACTAVRSPLCLCVQLWPLAIMIAQFIGPEAHHDTVRTMLDTGLQQGSVLHTFGLLATASHDRVASSLQGPAAPHSSPPTIPNPPDVAAPLAPAVFQPGAIHTPPLHPGPVAMHAPPGSVPPGPPQLNGMHPFMASSRGSDRVAWAPSNDSWPRTLLMMAANRTPGDAAALAGLGDHLWTLDRPHARAYAHVCYILAGKPPDPVPVADSRFVAPGVDDLACMGGCGAADSLQRVELLAWCMSQCQSLPMYWLAPSYLQVRHLVFTSPCNLRECMF